MASSSRRRMITVSFISCTIVLGAATFASAALGGSPVKHVPTSGPTNGPARVATNDGSTAQGTVDPATGNRASGPVNDTDVAASATGGQPTGMSSPSLGRAAVSTNWTASESATDDSMDDETDDQTGSTIAEMNDDEMDDSSFDSSDDSSHDSHDDSSHESHSGDDD
ncbi:MAG: hypothetical protein RLZZ623_2063 [Actinomycetota bacterium]